MIIGNTVGKIYYITQFAGNCKIMEINPANDYKHNIIAEIKSD